MTRIRQLICSAALLPLLAGCALTPDPPPTPLPNCPSSVDRDSGELNALTLTAQAVPTAALIPCLLPLPAGWTFRDMNAQKGRARTRLDLGSANTNAATVTLTHDCDVQDATPTSSDRRGTRRYERVDSTDSGFRGEWYYLFPGGCVTYRFDVHGNAALAAVAVISRSFGFVDRVALRRYVHDDSGGRLVLDPTPGQG